jgi:hypothetical protein
VTTLEAQTLTCANPGLQTVGAPLARFDLTWNAIPRNERLEYLHHL